ncbi:MAG TPA: hypothetical protein VK549_12830 [Acidimicrobiia bacterium]|nr:hypothetical protein [Acidimicrobiia bacterium]
MTDTEAPEPGSWAAVDQDSQRFRSLLKKYEDDYQRATDAYLRGEEGDPEEQSGSENPM